MTNRQSEISYVKERFLSLISVLCTVLGQVEELGKYQKHKFLVHPYKFHINIYKISMEENERA